MEGEKLAISWNKPSSRHFGLNYETFCKGQFENIEVWQNRFIRGDRKKGNNDISYKITGVSGWIDYEKFKTLLLKEAKQRAPRKKQLIAKNLIK